MPSSLQGFAFGSAPSTSSLASCGFVRELEEADVLLLDVGVQGVTTPPIKRLKDIHHKVAQLLASGMKCVEVSQATGMCQSRISILKNDPAFKDLLDFYQTEQRKFAVDQLQRVAMLSQMAVGELTTRLEEAPELMTDNTIVEIAKMSLDRSGHGPQSKTTHQHLHLSSADLNSLKGSVNAGNVQLLTPADRRADFGPPSIGESLPPVYQAPEEVGGAEEGKHVREEGTPGAEAGGGE